MRLNATSINRLVGLSVAILILTSVVSCKTSSVTSSDGRPLPPVPHEAAPAPAGAQANTMAFFVSSKPDDSNGNGFPDLIKVTVALFAQPHPTAVQASQGGSFVFTLFPQGQTGLPGVKELGMWSLEGDAVTRALARAQYGPCYQFRLSLLESAGGEFLQLDRADLVCRYVPPGEAQVVRSDGVRTIQVGRRMSVGAAATP